MAECWDCCMSTPPVPKECSANPTWSWPWVLPTIWRLPLAGNRPTHNWPRRWIPPGGDLDLLEQELEQSSEMIGHSRSMAQVQQSVRRAAPTSATVLIRGESGVGKELVARAIHRGSQRAAGPLVCLNCAALRPRCWKANSSGTKKELSPALRNARSVSLKPPTVGPCCWTKLERWCPSCKQNSCACSKVKPLNAWAAAARSPQMCG